MKASIDDLRRVAADLLRQGGDEVGARVLEKALDLCVAAERCAWMLPRSFWRLQAQEAFDVLAYVDPRWLATQVARAHGEALEEARQRQGWRVEVNPLVPPGTAYVFQPRPYMNPLVVTRVEVDPPERTVHMPVAPNLGIGGEEVAPPDEDDVP